MINSILIDPFKKEIKRVQIDYPGRGLDAFYDLLKTEKTKAIEREEGKPSGFLFTSVRLDKFNCLYVDDEGLLKRDYELFKIEPYPNPLAGRALVIGHDEGGETRSTDLGLVQIRKRVTWVEKNRTLVNPLWRFKVYVGGE